MRITLANNVVHLPDGEEICDVSLDLLRAAPDMLGILEELADTGDLEGRGNFFV